MSSYQIHLEQYKHNKKFVRFGILNTQDNFYDWEITVFFYAAIHLVEAILAKECSVESVHNHQDRSELLLEHKDVFGGVTKSFFKLQTLSHSARYSGYIAVSEKDCLKAQEMFEDIESDLEKYIT